MIILRKIASLYRRFKNYRRQKFIDRHFSGDEGAYKKWRWKIGLHPDE